MIAIELILSHSLFCLARTIKLLWWIPNNRRIPCQLLIIISGRRAGRLISLCLTNDHRLRRYPQVNYSCPVSRPASLRTVTLVSLVTLAHICTLHWPGVDWEGETTTTRCSPGRRPSSVMQNAEHWPWFCRLLCSTLHSIFRSSGIFR